MISCSGGVDNLRNSAQQALIASVNFAFSRKAWDDKERFQRNLDALDNALDFLGKVHQATKQFLVSDRDTRSQLELCQKAMVELDWFKPFEIYQKGFSDRIGAYHAQIKKAKQQFVHSSDRGLGAIDETLLSEPEQLFSKIYDTLATELLSQRQGCF